MKKKVFIRRLVNRTLSKALKKPKEREESLVLCPNIIEKFHFGKSSCDS